MENTTCNKWNIILNASCGNEIEDLTLIACRKLNEIYGYKYAYIVHDNDKDEIGNFKTIHSHIVLWKGGKTRKTTLINKLSEILNQNPNTISVDVCVSVKSSVRYLIHRDSPEKHQYLCGEIDSNAFEEVTNFLEDVDNDISGKTLYEIIKECDFDKNSVALNLGPTKYCRWYKFIELFCK